MTTSIFDVDELKRRLLNTSDYSAVFDNVSKLKEEAPVTGAAFFHRAENLLTKAEIDHLENHINESCEQLDD